jgi:hypothetical protein
MNAYPNVPCEVRILPNLIYQINNYKHQLILEYLHTINTTGSQLTFDIDKKKVYH